MRPNRQSHIRNKVGESPPRHERFSARDTSFVSLAKSTLFISALLFVLAIHTPDVVFSQISVGVPLLTKPVTLDGRLTSADEWSDTRQTLIPVYSLDGTERKDVLVWAKHDGKWLYLLYRTARFASDNPGDACTIYYHWGPGTIGSPGKPSDLGSVNKAGRPSDQYGWDGSRWYNDVDDGGTNDVEGAATQDSAYMWCEFRKKLDSGDVKHDWVLKVGQTYGGTDGQMRVVIFDATASKPYSGSIMASLLETSQATSPTTSGIASTPATPTTTLAEVSAASPTPFGIGTLAIIGVLAAVAVVSSALVLTRRRKTAAAQAVTLEPRPAPEPPSLKEKAVPVPSQPSISTGYAELDRLLEGGLPDGYSVVLVSPPCDERDLLLRKLIDSAVSAGRPTIYVSNDIGRTQDLVGRHWKNFYAYSPQADKIPSPPANLYKLPNIENLSDFSISLNKSLDTRVGEVSASKVALVDILSDMLLHHKALTTRKWLSEFVAKRKGQGFTILATLNPSITSKEEGQTIIEGFDGIIEIYEKELRERARRFLVVKKMYGRRYSESELMLDKDKLF